MANKSNIRSIRFTDELYELIDRQAGDTFTQKLENLVTRCVWELPRKERELENINAQIRTRREQLGRMTKYVEMYRAKLRTIETSLMNLDRAIASAQELKW